MKTYEYIEKPKNRFWKLCLMLFLLVTAFFAAAYVAMLGDGGVDGSLSEAKPALLMWAFIAIPILGIGYVFKD